jgi:hypothetical protein
MPVLESQNSAQKRAARFARLRWPAAVVAALLLLLWGAARPGGLLLSLMPVKGGPALIRVWLEPGEQFTIRYVHSVEGTPIWETHSVDAAGRIFIEEERYLKLGAGMGQMPGVGRLVSRPPYEIIEDMHQPTGNFILRIGSPGVDHTLIWRGREINLTQMAPHTAVQFQARPVSRWYRLLAERLFALNLIGNSS